MRTSSMIASLLLACLSSLPSWDARAQDVTRSATGASGVIEGAPWRIDIPADWNGDLVVQMHGYETVGVPRPDVSAPGEDAGVFLADGYAVAASSYATQGWAIEDAIADSERLRQHFVATYGKPERTLAIGYSMGGHVALATLETHGGHYDGALSLCGVNAPAAEVFVDGIVAPLVAVQYFFPGAMGLATGGLVDPASPPMLDGEALEAAFRTNEAAARRIAESLEVPRNTLADSLWLYYVILREAQQRAGGHPVDNTKVRYTGYGDDEAFNAGVPRYPGDADAVAYIERNFALTAEFDKPVVLLSNAVDPIVPRQFGVRYIALARTAGNDDLLTVLPPVGEGHCNFTDAQVRAALDALEQATREDRATGVLASPGVAAGSATYAIDPEHTFPSIEADHMGISVWRGKFNHTTGEVVLDRAGGTGTVEVEIDMASIDFGLDALNEHMADPAYFDTAQFPTATYTGTLAGFVDGAPTRVEGELTLRGITRPVTLDIRSFKCMPHPISKRDWCGADAHATIDREAFGIDEGKDWGFDMSVDLRIQVEAVAAE